MHIAARSDRLYVAEYGNHRIQVYAAGNERVWR